MKYIAKRYLVIHDHNFAPGNEIPTKLIDRAEAEKMESTGHIEIQRASIKEAEPVVEPKEPKEPELTDEEKAAIAAAQQAAASAAVVDKTTVKAKKEAEEKAAS